MNQPAWIPLVAGILRAAISEDWDKAAQNLKKIVDAYGVNEVPMVLATIIDQLVLRSDLPTDGRLKLLKFVASETGAIESADDVPPATRWTGRLIMARAEMDKDAYWALVRSVETDQQWADNCWAVVQMVALNLRQGGIEIRTGMA